MKIREIKQHNSFSIGIILFLFFFDLLSFYTSYYAVATILEAGSIINYPLIIVFGIIILFYLFGRYNPSSLQSRSAEFKIIVSLTSLSTFVYLIYKISFQIITIKQSQYIVFLVFLFLIIVTISRLFIRTAQKQLLKWNVGLRNSIIIGSGDIGCEFLKKINNKEYLGYKIIGYFEFSDTIPKSIKENIFNLDEVYIGFLSEVNEFISNNNIKEVIIALNTNNNDKLLQIIADLKSCNVCIKIVPNIYDILKGYAKMHSVTGMPLIDVNPNILTEFQIILKRLIDIIVSIIGLSIMLIPFLIIALLIKISSPGKIIFKQRRIGLNGVEFIVHKFRTMHSNS